MATGPTDAPLCSWRSAPPIAASVWQPLEVWLAFHGQPQGGSPVTDVVVGCGSRSSGGNLFKRAEANRAWS